MINVRASFVHNIGKWLFGISLICFVLPMALSASLLAQEDIKPLPKLEVARKQLNSWLDKLSIPEWVKKFLAAKSTIRVALLEGDQQVLKPRKAIYFGFFAKNESYKVKLVGINKDCSQIITSDRQEDFYHVVVFNQCQFIDGDIYNIAIEPSKGNKFTIKDKGCDEYTNIYSNLKELHAYQLAYDKDLLGCVFEAYQIVAESNQTFAQMLALRRIPHASLP